MELFSALQRLGLGERSVLAQLQGHMRDGLEAKPELLSTVARALGRGDSPHEDYVLLHAICRAATRALAAGRLPSQAAVTLLVVCSKWELYDEELLHIAWQHLDVKVSSKDLCEVIYCAPWSAERCRRNMQKGANATKISPFYPFSNRGFNQKEEETPENRHENSSPSSNSPQVANFTVRDLALEPLCTELAQRAERAEQLQVEPDVVRLLAGLQKLRHKDSKLIDALAPRVLEAKERLHVRSLCNLIKAFAAADAFPSPDFFVELLRTAVRRLAGVNGLHMPASLRFWTVLGTKRG